MAEIMHVDRSNGTAIDQADRDRLPDWQRSRGTFYDATPRHKGLDWRVWLAIVLLIGGPCLYLLIRFAEFLSDASYQTSWLDAWIVAALKLSPLGFIGIGLYWLYGKARAANLTRLQNNMPVSMRAVERPEWTGVAVGSVQAFYATEQEWARHSAYRSLNTLDLSQSGGRQSEQEHTAPEVAAPPALDVLPPDEWLAWFDERPHGLLAAETGGGKSTTAKAILSRRIAQGGTVFVIDPHSSEWLGLPSVGGGENWTEVRAAMEAVYAEYQQRLDARDQHMRDTGAELPPEHFSRLTVLLDEANTARVNLDKAKRTEISPWHLFAQVLGSGARKVNISILLLCQSAAVEDLGLSAAMRRNFTRLALDDLTIKRMIQQEEKEKDRREHLYARLVGRDYPATCVMHGRVYLLDRTGLNRLTRPSLAAIHAAVWTGWDFEDRSASVSVQDAPNSTELDMVPSQTPTDTPQTDAEKLMLLVRLRRQGYRRADARAIVAFDNDEWAEAGRLAVTKRASA